MGRIRSVSAAVALGLLISACGGDSTTESAAAPVVEAGAPAVLPTVSGAQLDLGSLEGQDTVLWFWAPW